MHFYTLPALLLCLRRVFTGNVMTHREHDCRTTVSKIAPPARVFCWTGSSSPPIKGRQSLLRSSHGPEFRQSTGRVVTPEFQVRTYAKQNNSFLPFPTFAHFGSQRTVRCSNHRSSRPGYILRNFAMGALLATVIQGQLITRTIRH
jgi:hypothetical protein